MESQTKDIGEKKYSAPSVYWPVKREKKIGNAGPI